MTEGCDRIGGGLGKERRVYHDTRIFDGFSVRFCAP
jgi:hypothetical protein